MVEQIIEIAKQKMEPWLQKCIEEQTPYPLPMEILDDYHHTILSHLLHELDEVADSPEKQQHILLYGIAFAINDILKDKRIGKWKLAQRDVAFIRSVAIVPYFLRYCPELRKMFFRLATEVVNEKVSSAPHIMKRVFAWYDRELFTLDLVSFVVSTILHKYNPIDIRNIAAFFADVLRKVLWYKLGGKLADGIAGDVYSLIWEHGLFEKVVHADRLYETVYLQAVLTRKNYLTTVAMVHIQLLLPMVRVNELRGMIGSVLWPTSQKRSMYDFFGLAWLWLVHPNTIQHIRERWPAVYKILRAIPLYKTHQRATRFPKEVELHITNLIKRELTKHFDSEWSEKVATKAATSCVSFLQRSVFIDMLTLQEIRIKWKHELGQILDFIEWVLKELKTKKMYSEELQ